MLDIGWWCSSFYAGQTNPAIFHNRWLEVKPLAIYLLHFFCLSTEYAGQRNLPATTGGTREQRGKQLERIGENVGYDYVRLALWRLIRQVELRRYLVGCRIVAAGLYGLVIQIHADGGCCTEL